MRPVALSVCGLAVLFFGISACERVHEPWMGKDRETKMGWQSPPTAQHEDQLRIRMMTSQTDR